jgi:hypothetical protein
LRNCKYLVLHMRDWTETKAMFGRAPSAAPVGALPNAAKCSGSGCGAGDGAPRGNRRRGGARKRRLRAAPCLVTHIFSPWPPDPDRKTSQKQRQHHESSPPAISSGAQVGHPGHRNRQISSLSGGGGSLTSTLPSGGCCRNVVAVFRGSGVPRTTLEPNHPTMRRYRRTAQHSWRGGVSCGSHSKKHLLAAALRRRSRNDGWGLALARWRSNATSSRRERDWGMP